MNALEHLRAAQDRDFGQEGIPMILALVDETEGLGSPEPTGDQDAVLLVDLLDRLRAELAPTRREDDLGITATLLATAAWVDDTGATA